ncbi:hypothetical protein ACFU3J_07620 [Streptomyces sp. NPDC057411]|uniref:hypothetical protein n=1 Tax=unclassified Streptomyces TaxID=2593676 RepID=UPI003626974C
MSNADADWAARILLAATDGIQLQWLLEPTIDMAGDIGRLRDVLLQTLNRGREREPGSEGTPLA